MRKLLLALGLVCFTTPVFAAQDINAGISGSWFNKNKDGHGFAIEYTDCPESPEGCLVVFWFVYSPTGEPIFLLGSGLPINGNVAEGDLHYFSGQHFGTFTPTPPPVNDVWGTLTLTFESCDKGTASYESKYVSPDGDDFTGSDEFPIHRLAFVSDLDCARAEALADVPTNPLAGWWVGSITPQGSGPVPMSALITEAGVGYFFGDEFGPYLFSGELGSSNGEVTLPAYPVFGLGLPNGQPSGQVTLDIQLDPPDRLEGTFTAPGADGPVTGSFALQYMASFARDATLQRIQGSWLYLLLGKPIHNGILTIAADGSLSVDNLSNGCKLDGQVTPAGDGEFNVYDAVVEVTGCDFDGTYHGQAWVVDSGAINQDGFLYMRLENGRWSLNGEGIPFG